MGSNWDTPASTGRRAFCAAVVGGSALVTMSSLRAQSSPLRIGTTSVILDDQLGFMRAWRDYLAPKVGRAVVFVQRGSYREISSMLLGDELDFAWICGYPYVRHRASLDLVALPNYQGRPVYRSYLIVPAGDRVSRDFAALAGKVFAYSDPDSNSGFLVPQFEMLRSGIRPDGHFRKTFFTYAHRKVVRAVADGVADGGAVDGYVWETLARRVPELTRRTRVARVSDEYGFPPIVARRTLDRGVQQLFRETLLSMRTDSTGNRLLGQLNLEGFLPPDEGQFAGIAQVLAYVSARERLPT